MQGGDQQSGGDSYGQQQGGDQFASGGGTGGGFSDSVTIRFFPIVPSISIIFPASEFVLLFLPAHIIGTRICTMAPQCRVVSKAVVTMTTKAAAATTTEPITFALAASHPRGAFPTRRSPTQDRKSACLPKN